MCVRAKRIVEQSLGGWLVGMALGLLVAGGATGQSVAPAAFFSTMEDLPLMSGLVEIADEGLVFDKPEGRVVEAVAAGAVSREAVVAYYEAALPELGWKRRGIGEFARSGEVLRYRLETAGGTTEIRFTIVPNEQAGRD